MAKDTAEQLDRTVVYLGNRNGVEVVEDPDADAPADGEAPKMIRQPIGGPKKKCTTVVLPPGTPLLEAATLITDPARGVWRSHSDDPAPAWVASTDPELARLLGAQYGCEVRDPEPDTALTGDQEG
ncbi:hypothetical protein AB0F93_00120 [Micromonospora tulbaghiae]|uniref:hypothetical protein n=1 Tax=Micromonospora tulbaghiae TaxID=479978 RepID=UPI00331C06B8